MMHLLYISLQRTRISSSLFMLRVIPHLLDQKRLYKAKNRRFCCNELQLIQSYAFHSSILDYKIFGTYNPFKALDTWHDLEKLKNEWDPDFNLSEFKQGAVQALYTIVFLIQENCWQDLRGLLSRPLLEKLQQDNEILEKISNTEISQDLITASIYKVVIQEIVDRKYCDIEITFIVRSVNQTENREPDFTYLLRFHREYTQGKLPEWTVTKLQIEDKKIEK